MRTYSQFEKEFIQRIVNTDPLDSNISTFIINSILYNRGIIIDESDNTISLLFFKNDSTAVSEFFEMLSLLKNLIASDLLYIHSNIENELGSKNFLSKNFDQNYLDQNGENISYIKVPTDVYGQIRLYLRSYFYVGTELKRFFDNGFISTEELQYQFQIKEAKKQTKLSQISLIIALLALIVSVVLPLL